MDLPIEGLPDPPHSSRGRLLVPLLVVISGLLGCFAAINVLKWHDLRRKEQAADAERERIAQIQKNAPKPPADETGAKEPDAKPVDPLRTANEQFRDIHRLARGDAIAQTSPIILVQGDDLVLFYRGTRQSVAYLPALYHELKGYSHLPLAAYLASRLDPHDTAFPPVRNQELAKLRGRMTELRDDLKKRTYPSEVMDRQQKLIDATSAFLDACLSRIGDKKPLPPENERDAFARGVRDAILANVKAIAQLQIEALDSQVKKWRESALSPDEFKNLKVIVIGSPMPRAKNLAVQYFAWLLNEPVDDRFSKRIIYAESLFDETRALNLLGLHVVDEDIGRAFFQEKSRLRRDLLGDDAEAILESMKRP